jgi:hypothetical protein
MDQGLGSILNQFDPRMAALMGWVVFTCKIVVDWIKSAVSMPKWGPPVSAFITSLVLIILLMLALGIGLTGQLAAQATIMALISAALSIASTALQARTNPATDTVTANAIARETTERVVTQTPTATDIALETVKLIREQMAGPVTDEEASDIYERGRIARTTRSGLREVSGNGG